MSPFEIANNICSSTTDLWDETLEKEYNSYMINRALSYHYDTIMFAQEMNSKSHLPKKQQYDFLRLSIQPKKKRFAKWSKREEDDIISLLTEAYNISPRLAQSYLPLLNNSDLKEIEMKLNKGGR